MPIVRTYDDIGALGSAALLGGAAPGFAQGREQQLNRRSADQRFVMGEIFNRQNQENQAQNQQDALASQAGYRAAETTKEQQFQASELQTKLAAEQKMRDTETQNKYMLDAFQSVLGQQKAMELIDAKHQADMKANNVKAQQDKSRFIQEGTSSGKFASPDEAGAAYDASMVDKTQGVGAFARHPVTGNPQQDAVFKAASRFPDPTQRSAVYALAAGNASKFLQTTNAAILGDFKKRRYAPQIMEGLQNAMIDVARDPNAVDSVTLGRAVSQLPPGQFKDQMIEVFRARTAWGSNQQGGATTGGPGAGLGGGMQAPAQADPSSLSNDDILNELRKNGLIR